MPVLGRYPPIAFISVDLPAPLVPMSPTISFAPTSSDTASVATRPPKRTVTSEATKAGPESARSGRALQRDCRRRVVDRLRRSRAQPLLRPPEKRVSRRVRDLHEPAREVQQEDEEAHARREQRDELVVREEGGEADDPQRAEYRAGDGPEPADHRERNELEGALDREEPVGEGNVGDERTQEGPAERGDTTGKGEGARASRGRARRCIRRRCPGCRARRWWCGRYRNGAVARRRRASPRARPARRSSRCAATTGRVRTGCRAGAARRPSCRLRTPDGGTDTAARRRRTRTCSPRAATHGHATRRVR